MRNAAHSSASIYAHLGSTSAAPTREARQARRLRREARVAALVGQRPDLSVDRVTPIHDLLRSYREDRGLSRDGRAAIDVYLARVTAEVEALERWARARRRREHLSGAAVRQALDFLTSFGRITALDFSCIPIEERDALVTLLALEHRWCYAAAGTTRDALKIAIGRTGAR